MNKKLRTEELLNSREELMRQSIYGQPSKTYLLNLIDRFHENTNKLNEDLCFIIRDIITSTKYIQPDLIQAYGSATTNLALKDSDVDIYIEGKCAYNKCGLIAREDKTEDMLTFKQIEKALRYNKLFSEIIALRDARVPILKCKNKATDRYVDINFCNPNGIKHAQFLKKVCALDKRIHQLILFLKIWGKHLNILAQDGLTSHALITLIIYALQQPINKSVGAILPSMHKMQENVKDDDVVMGVDYAFDFGIVKPLPADYAFMDLLRHVFTVWKNLNFNHFIISPYFANQYLYENSPTYVSQLKDRAYYHNCSTDELELKFGNMCVQDIFCLSLNITSNIQKGGVDYFTDRIQVAYILCHKYATSSELFFDRLLFGSVIPSVIKQVEKKREEKKPKEKQPLVHINQAVGTQQRQCVIRMSRGERKFLSQSYKNIWEIWLQGYLDVIKHTLLEIFLCEIFEVNDKIWELSCTLNTWSGRNVPLEMCKNFFAKEKERTLKFIKTCNTCELGDKSFKAILSITTDDQESTICLKIQPKDMQYCMTKNGPMYTFFSAMQNTILSINFKKYLQLH